MIKFDKSVKNRKREIFMCVGGVCNLVAAALIVTGIVSDKFALEQYGFLLIWISAIVNFLNSEIRVFKYKHETEKTLENTISKTQVKAKAMSFDLTMLVSLIVCLICSLIFSVNEKENSQLILGIYASSVVLFVIMLIAKIYFISKFRKHITE